MYLPIRVQRVLMNEIVSAIENDRSITSSGAFDYNASTNNEFFKVDENTYFVVYCPNATDDEGDEHFNMIALDIMEYDEPIYVNRQIKDVHELLYQLDLKLGSIDIEV